MKEAGKPARIEPFHRASSFWARPQNRDGHRDRQEISASY
jgi:hypothetical protein